MPARGSIHDSGRHCPTASARQFIRIARALSTRPSSAWWNGERLVAVSVFLGTWRPAEQFPERRFGRPSLIENFIDLLDDRHRNAGLPSEVERGASRANAFGHHLCPREDVSECPSPGKLDADLPVAG